MTSTYLTRANELQSAKKFSAITLPKTGMLPQKLEHYLKLISNPYIKLLCEPLKKINIGYFLYAKRFTDSSYIYLTNLPGWKSYYFNNYYYLISDFDDPDKEYQTGTFLWNGLTSQVIYENLRAKFNIAHGITLVQSYQDCSEFFHFGSALENHYMINFYLNNCDLLKKFTLYFKDKAGEIIDAISKSRIIIPKREKNTGHNFEIPKNEIHEFMQLTKIDRYYISDERSDIYLTKREMECLKWYSMGKTAEETGIILGISKRTAEDYLANAKAKINFLKKGKIISSFIGDLI